MARTPTTPRREHLNNEARANREAKRQAAANREALPPDPEGMNGERSDWANTVIGSFRCETGTDLEDAVCDLLADLMHWCDRNGQTFEQELDRARRHYTEETRKD